MDSAISFLLFFLFIRSSLFSLVRCGFPRWSLPGVNPLTLLSVIVLSSLLWATAFCLCRRNASPHMWLYVFGLSRVHHPKSSCELLLRGVPGDVALAGSWSGPRAANTICHFSGSLPTPAFGVWASATSALQTHPDPASFPLQRLPALRVWITPCSFFSRVNRVSVSLNIKAFVSPQRVAEASCG